MGDQESVAAGGVHCRVRGPRRRPGRRPQDPRGARRFLDLYIASLLVWGLVAIEVRLTVFGAVLIAYGQLWRIDRLGIFYDVEAPGR
ncbi:hypothetical protein SAZ11_02630 [Streptomyces sp. FXJ1.4098]|nr:hypothetical protein [Streptomyces sp. FXJ1.4098]